MKLLLSRFSRLATPPSKRAPFWIATGVFLRLAAFSFFMASAHSNNLNPEGGLLFLTGGDSDSYILPAENLLNRGSYIQDLRRPDSRAGRMPAYGATYLIFRMATDQTTAKSCLAIFQVLLGGISVYYLALLARNIFHGDERVFLFSFLLFGTSTYVSQMDLFIQTESLAVSSIIFAAYCLERFIAIRRSTLLLWAGMWLTYSTFLRPYIVVVFPVFVIAAYSVSGGSENLPSLPMRIKRVVLVLAPFIFFDGAWIARNYHAFSRVIPAQVNLHAAYDQPSAYWAFQRFCSTVGADMIYWRPNTLGAWFFPNARFSPTNYSPPLRIFTPTYGLADLERIRHRYRLLSDQPGGGIGSPLDLELARELNRFSDEFRRTNPISYHLFSPIRALGSMLIHSGPQYMPLNAFRELVRNPPALAVKLFSVGSYWFIILFGLTFMSLGWSSRDQSGLYFLAIPILILLALAFVFRCTEDRYILPAFPFFALFAAGGIGTLFKWADAWADVPPGN